MIKVKEDNIFNIKSLPENWRICKLEDSVNIIGGSQPPKKTFKTEYENGYVRLIQIRDYKSERFLTYVPINSTKKFCSKNDVMIGRYGPPVFQILRGLEGAYNVALMKAEPKSNMYSEYLFHLLSSKPVQDLVINNSKRTAGQTGVNLRLLNNCLIPLPPIIQQKKIANILDAADALRQNDKALIAKYDKLTQALFLDMFGDPVCNPKGWEIKPLGKVCKIQGGYSFKSTDFVQSGVKLVKIANVNFQFLDWEDTDVLPEDFIYKYSSFSLCEGDILMALTRPIIKSLGTVKAVTVKKTDLPALLNQRVARFFPKTEVLSKDFLLRIIYSDFFKNKIEKLSSTSLQPNVSNKQVENIEIFIPPLNQQIQFAERVAVIEEQKAIAQKSLEKSEELFNSLLQKAFKGELL